MPSYRIICDVECDNLRRAIDITELIVEDGYVEFARVLDDGDGTYVPEPALLDIGDNQHIKLSNLDGEVAITFLYERAKKAGYEEGEEAGAIAVCVDLRQKLDSMMDVVDANGILPGAEAYDMGYGDAWRAVSSWLGNRGRLNHEQDTPEGLQQASPGIKANARRFDREGEHGQ